MEHCVSAFKVKQEEKAYRIYVTDSLKAISEGKHLVGRYADIILPQKEETRDAEEIKSDILNKLKEL